MYFLFLEVVTYYSYYFLLNLFLVSFCTEVIDTKILDLLKSTPNILGQVYADVAQPSVKAIGAALGTVLEFSTSILLPVKLLNEKL